MNYYHRHYDETNILPNRKISHLSANDSWNEEETAYDLYANSKRNGRYIFHPMRSRNIDSSFSSSTTSYLHFNRIYLIRFLCLYKVFLQPFYGKFIFIFHIQFDRSCALLAPSLINLPSSNISFNITAKASAVDGKRAEKATSSNREEYAWDWQKAPNGELGKNWEPKTPKSAHIEHISNHISMEFETMANSAKSCIYLQHRFSTYTYSFIVLIQ